MPFWLPANLALPEPAGGACLLCRPPAFCFSFVSAPIPPPPFPSGEGGDSKYISPGATAPGTPATGWEAALDLLWENGTFSLSGKKFSTEGKDSNAAGDADTIGDYPCRTPTPQVQQVPHGFRLRGCKGLRPLHKITFSLPLPAGKGVGGMGAKIFFHPKNPAGRNSKCRTGLSGFKTRSRSG